MIKRDGNGGTKRQLITPCTVDTGLDFFFVFNNEPVSENDNKNAVPMSRDIDGCKLHIEDTAH